MNTIKLTFVAGAGKSFPVSMNYADPELTGAEGTAKLQAAVAAVIAQQPFEAVVFRLKRLSCFMGSSMKHGVCFLVDTVSVTAIKQTVYNDEAEKKKQQKQKQKEQKQKLKIY